MALSPSLQKIIETTSAGRWDHPDVGCSASSLLSASCEKQQSERLNDRAMTQLGVYTVNDKRRTASDQPYHN